MSKGKHSADRAYKVEKAKLASFKHDGPAFWVQNDVVAKAEKKASLFARMFS